MNPSQAVVDQSGGLLYFTNFGSNTVSVLEINSRRVLASIEVGAEPDALALTPDGRYVLVLGSQSNDLAVVDAVRRSLLTVVPLGQKPRAICPNVFEAPAEGQPQPAR